MLAKLLSQTGLGLCGNEFGSIQSFSYFYIPHIFAHCIVFLSTSTCHNYQPKNIRYKSARERNVENRCVSSASHVATGKSPDLSSFFGAILVRLGTWARHRKRAAPLRHILANAIYPRYCSPSLLEDGLEQQSSSISPCREIYR